MQLTLRPDRIEDYRLFLAIKALPKYEIRGRIAEFPDEYAATLGLETGKAKHAAYEPLAFLFDYQRDITAMAIDKRKFAVFADCVGGETIIDGPDGPRRIDELAESGRPFRVWSLNSCGERVPATTSLAWVNGYASLYRFSFASGKSLVATLGHRFLTPEGWKRGESLQIGQRLAGCGGVHPLSISEPCRLESPAGDRYSRRTLQDSQAGCSGGSRQCDEPLPSATALARELLPLQADAPERGQRWLRADGLVHRPGHNHRRRGSDRPSMLGSGFQDASAAAAVECQPLSSAASPSRENSHTAPQVGEGTIPAMQAPSPRPSADRSFGAVQFSPRSVSCDWDTLLSVDYIRDDAFYDLEVPEFGNYLANGIWSHNCGLGKTPIMLEFVRHVAEILPRKKKLIVCPLMVIDQTLAECQRFYGNGLPIEQVTSANLPAWLAAKGGEIGITNYEAIVDGLCADNLATVVLDESSVLKNHSGKWGTRLIELAAGVEYKLALTGTPAPNDRIEYANHAVFLDQFPTVNAFLARYFVNRGQTQERWEIKQHAIGAFYRSLSHWGIFLSNPAVYGWQDNCGTIPPIHVHIHDVDLTHEQERLARNETGTLFASQVGGIAQRTTLGRLAKGHYKGQDVATEKPQFIRDLVSTWPDESTIIWCLYNKEQEELEKLFPGCASIEGSTPHEKRMELLADFKAGRRKVLLSKPRVLGFGLNLQIATRQVFSGLQDSYESYYQAVKRSNRIGSTRPLNVHIPVTTLEEPMVENVLRKARNIERDTDEQEELFRNHRKESA